MDEELSTLCKTDTWDLIPLPPGKSVVGCRWVYKIKTNSDWFIEGYKARLVAKGYSQQYGVATQFFTHVFDNFSEKNKNIKKTTKTP